jgi:HK97 gp10 family phage protein
MAKMVDISILGEKALQRKLKRLAGPAQRKIVMKALREGGRPVLAAAKARVPVATGRLRKSLRLRKRRTSGSFFGMEVRTGTREELGISPDSKGYYPMSVEFGHAGVAARPFLRPAMDGQRSKALRIIGREIAAGILREARKT